MIILFDLNWHIAITKAIIELFISSEGSNSAKRSQSRRMEFEDGAIIYNEDKQTSYEYQK